MADYTVAATPPSITLTAGTQQTFSVSVRAVNGFSSPVAFSLSGLPSGVTASPATFNLTPGAAQNVTLTADAGTATFNGSVSITGTAGSLSHAATLTLSVSAPAPAADFSLALTPPSLTLTAGATGQTVSVTATALNGFTGTVSVALTGLPAGVTANPSSLTLTPGTAQNTTLTAASTAAASSSSVLFTGSSGSLTHTASLSLVVHAASSGPPPAAPDVTTYHYDNARDGLNAQESILTPANVDATGFGKIGSLSVDGQVDAQPLFLNNLSVGGQARNVLYIATEHGSVYAFDADSFTQLWKASLIPGGESPSDPHNCNQISPEIGITATPVIDRNLGAHGTLFAVAMSKDGSGNYHQRLYALDITSGAQLQSPTEITASYPGGGANSQNGNVIFDPAMYAERAALLLLNGDVYTAWTSHCDQSPYTGWIMAFIATTLKQTRVLNLTPNGALGAIWMSGDGLAADTSGSIYLLDGNGTFDTSLTNGMPAQGDYGNAMLRLSTQSDLQVADYFETYNTTTESDEDKDFGSGGILLLPDLKDTNGDTRQLVVGAGKDGAIYLADRKNLGKYNPSSGAPNSNIYQYLPGVLGGVFSTPAYFNDMLYYGSANQPLQAFPIQQARLMSKAQSASATSFAFPGPTPAISANGLSNGIVWAVESNPGNAAVLHAYDAADLGHELYNSTEAPGGRDSFGQGNKFVAPLVVNGKVYIGTPGGVAVFGLLSH